jgi:hypothetical protein
MGKATAANVSLPNHNGCPWAPAPTSRIIWPWPSLQRTVTVCQCPHGAWPHQAGTSARQEEQKQRSTAPGGAKAQRLFHAPGADWAAVSVLILMLTLQARDVQVWVVGGAASVFAVAVAVAVAVGEPGWDTSTAPRRTKHVGAMTRRYQQPATSNQQRWQRVPEHLST